NAFKFVPGDGRIRVSLRQSATDLVIAVDDSGPGVTPELRQGIFERFRQGDGGITRTAGGTGLGLAIAKEFVEMHKGRIDVGDSDLGGARFEVTIPLNTAASADQRAAHGPADAGGESASIDHTTLDGIIAELRFATPDRGTDGAASSGVGSPWRAPTGTDDRSIAPARVLVVEDNPDMNRFVTECLGRHYEV